MEQPTVTALEMKASKPLDENTLGVVLAEETPSLTGEFVEEIHGV